MFGKTYFGKFFLRFGRTYTIFAEFILHEERVKYNGKRSFYLLLHLLMHSKVPCKERDCWEMEENFQPSDLKERKNN